MNANDKLNENGITLSGKYYSRKMQGQDLLDRIYSRLSGCNAGAGWNFIGIEDLRSAFSVVNRCKKLVSDEAFDTERHTAIRCVHSTDALKDTIHEIVKHYAPHAPASLTIELLSTFTKIMWDHADEIAGVYRDILRRQK